MTTSALGIDVSKDTLDVNVIIRGKGRRKHFDNSTGGWAALLAWLRQNRLESVRACLEATGRHSTGVALALHDAGHVVSIVNPAQIRDFATLLTPRPWTPPSPALRRLCELHTMRAGFMASPVEWKNRAGSGLENATAVTLAQNTIQHFNTQIEAVDQAILQTINDDDDFARQARPAAEHQWSRRRAGRCAAVAVAWPRNHTDGGTGRGLCRPESPIASVRRLGASADPHLPVGNAKLRTALLMPAIVAIRFNPVIAAFAARLRARGRLKGKQVVVAAMRKLLMICFGVLKSGKPFDPAIAMAA